MLKLIVFIHNFQDIYICSPQITSVKNEKVTVICKLDPTLCFHKSYCINYTLPIENFTGMINNLRNSFKPHLLQRCDIMVFEI